MLRKQISFNGERQALEMLQDGVAVIHKGKVIYANAALARILGLLDSSQLLGGDLEKQAGPLSQGLLGEWLLEEDLERGWREFRLPGKGREPAIVEVSSPRSLTWGECSARMVLLRDITEQMARASHREQQRIARDLHDGLGQELAAVALKAKVLENELKPMAEENVSALSADLVSLAKEASTRARDISHYLAPVDIAPEGLSGMLKRLLSTTALLFGFEYSFSSFCEGLRLPPETSMELYRAVQEALTNAYRHGRASHIRMEGECDHGYLRLSIEDNGKGLPENFNGEASEGMGLKIMRHRIVSLGGNCSICKPTRESTGLRVTFDVPLPEGEEHRSEAVA